MSGQTHLAPSLSGAIQSSDKWANLALFLIVGYLGIGKPFAYLGLPQISLFIGEMALAAFLLFGPRTNRGTWLKLTQRIRPLKRFEWLLLFTLLYGVFEALRGTLKGYSVVAAIRDTAFDYYPIFLLLGVWVGLRDRRFLSRVIRSLSFWAGCYGFAYVLFLSRIPWTVPGTEGRVPVFLGPYGASAVALLGLLTLEPQLKRVWHLVLLNLFVLLGVQVRAEWVGFAAGVVAFVVLTKRLKQLALAVSAFVILLGLMYATGLSLETPVGRGSKVGTKISADYLVARAIAPLNRNLADDLAPANDVSFAASTVAWRTVWWASIWKEVHAQLSTALFGFGYGYPIGSLNPDIGAGTFIQTPHNDIFYALAFCGWVGVLLFLLVQVEIFKLLLQSCRMTGQSFGVVCWTALFTMSLFEDFFEAPFAAIPFFLLMGAAIAPSMLRARGASPNGSRGSLRLSPNPQQT